MKKFEVESVFIDRKCVNSEVKPMNSSRLYIIGNGFDRYHGIPSEYSQFGEYVRGHDSKLHEAVEQYIAFDGNWGSFETSLADCDAHSIYEEAMDFMKPYGADDWRESDNHAPQEYVKEKVDLLSTRLKRVFAEWAFALPIPNRSNYSGPTLQLDALAFFMNFNYTSTLQTLYGVDPKNILHIHNEASSPDADLILGHGWKPTSRAAARDEDSDFREIQADELLDRYFRRTYKPTAAVLAAHQQFFHNLSS